jgi:hypothetical protein
MGDTFLGNVGGKLTDQFLVQFYAPASVFWAGGAALYARANWAWLKPVVTELSQSNGIVLVAASLLLVTASAAVGQRFEPALIRLLEGYYWPSWFSRWRKVRFENRYNNYSKLFQKLYGKVEAGSATPEERRQLVDADVRLHGLPAKREDIMPTIVGNILRAAERRIDEKYGLDPRICWARLWTLLPKEVREDVSASRNALDIGGRSFLWGGLFAVWTIWWWWALPIAVVAVFASYLWMVNAAAEYGELLEAAFDMYRLSLYKSLCIEPPSDSTDERPRGKALTQYLWRGSDGVLFVNPKVGAPGEGKLRD